MWLKTDIESQKTLQMTPTAPGGPALSGWGEFDASCLEDFWSTAGVMTTRKEMTDN